MLEEDTTPDKRISESADALKKRGIDDYQLYYALKTIARLGGPTEVAMIDKLGVHKPVPQLPPEKPDTAATAPKSN